MSMEAELNLHDKSQTRFRVVLHRPDSNDEGEASMNENLEQNGGFYIDIDSSSNLSSLASKFLRKLYEQGMLEDKAIMKASNVKVLLQVRPTWKPLPLSSFVYKQDQSDLDLETVFGSLLHMDDNEMVAHLHICTEKTWTDETAREVVKQLLQNHSQTQLERLNCPFSQGMLSQISRDQYYCRVSAEKVRLFGQWYESIMSPKPENSDDIEEIRSRQGYASQRSKKIVFNPKEELPILRAAFEIQPHPSTQTMTKLAKELNQGEFRKINGRERVDFRHVNNWFKNERSRVKKGSTGSIREFSQATYRTETEYSGVGSGNEDEDVTSGTEEG